MSKIIKAEHKYRKRTDLIMAYQILKHDLKLSSKERRNLYMPDFVQFAIIERHFTPASQATVMQVLKRGDYNIDIITTYFLENQEIDENVDIFTENMKKAFYNQLEQQAKKHYDLLEKEDDVYTTVKNPISEARKVFLDMIIDVYDSKTIEHVKKNFKRSDFDKKALYMPNNTSRKVKAKNKKGRNLLILDDSDDLIKRL